MRDTFIDRQFEHFRIDHDETALFRRVTIEQGQDHRVDANRLTRTRRTRDQQVGHLGKVDHGWHTANVFAERHWQAGPCADIGFGLKQRAQVNRVTVFVWQLDANRILAGNHRHTGRDRAHRAGNVVRQGNHTGRFDARSWFHFEQCNDRAGTHFLDAAAYTEFLQNIGQARSLLEQCIFVHRIAALFRHLEQVDRGQARGLAAAVRFRHTGLAWQFRLGDGYGQATRLNRRDPVIFVFIQVFIIK